MPARARVGAALLAVFETVSFSAKNAGLPETYLWTEALRLLVSDACRYWRIHERAFRCPADFQGCRLSE